jgi:hypothetical protein
MQKLFATAAMLAALGAGAPAFSGDLPDEHWRCGPYRITIVPGPDYSREQNNQFEDCIVIKNGKRLHSPNRMRILTTEDGARSAWWEGFSGETVSEYKYDAWGELITRNGKSYYSEQVTGGRTGKVLSQTPKYPCTQGR